MSQLRNPAIALLFALLSPFVVKGEDASAPRARQSLPTILAEHTLRDTGLRRKLVITAQDGRQIVVELPVLAYIPDFQGVDFLTMVKEAPVRTQEAEPPPTSRIVPVPEKKTSPKEDALFAAEETPPAAPPASASKTVTPPPDTGVQELREITKSVSKLERSASSDETANDIRAIMFRLNALVKQMEGSP
jgi:hypothetical protein